MTNPLAVIDNICFFDTETRADAGASVSDGNVKTAGTYRYAQNAFVIIGTFAIGDDLTRSVGLDRFDGDWLCWADMPADLREFHKRVEQREAWYAAWNAGFDRNAWNHGTYDFPVLEPDMVIDVMAQAVTSNLPPALEDASRVITGRGKQDDGKALINLFTRPDGPQPGEREEEWQRFISYALRDTDEMRAVWKATRPLSMDEWEDYWISEKINERGMAVDVDFAALAGAVADAEAARIARELARWTNGQITAATQVQRIAEWVYDRIDRSEAREIMVKAWDEDAAADDPEADLKPAKLSLAKDRIAALLAFYEAQRAEHGLSETEALIVDVLQARQFGGNSSPQKFHKIVAQETGGRLRGQYVFNGAAMTGRFSSRGVQIHNLIRDSLKGVEAEAIEMVNELGD